MISLYLFIYLFIYLFFYLYFLFRGSFGILLWELSTMGEKNVEQFFINPSPA